MSSCQYLLADKPIIPMRVAEDKDVILKRILANVPRRKRTCCCNDAEHCAVYASVPKTVPEDKDVILKRILANVPRRKRTCCCNDAEHCAVYVSVPKTVPEDKDVISKRTLANVPRRDPQDSPKPPEWLVQVMRRMNGADDPKLIVEKTLDLNDVDPRQNRLLIPIDSVIQKDFFTLDEARIIDNDETRSEGNMGVGAFLVDQRTKTWNVGLGKLFMTTDLGNRFWSFVLRGEWSYVVEANGFKIGDKISLWSFRCREFLCFALVPSTSSAVVFGS